MTKQKEVLELALDTHIKNESHRTVEETRYWCDQYKLLAQTAIKALAQPELCKYGQEPKSCTSSPMDCQCALDATFAQPEQEPVAFICQGNVYMADDVDEYCTATHIPLYTKEQL